MLFTGIIKCKMRSKRSVLILLLIFFVAGIYYYTHNTASETIDHNQILFADKFDTSIKDGKNTKKKLLLLWSPIFNEYKLSLDDCLLKDKCSASINKEDLSKADAVIFHDLADINYPKKSFPDQKFVWYTMESPSNVKHRNMPLNYFDWLMSHLSLSDVRSPYGGYWVNPKNAKEQGLLPENLPYDEETILSNKTIEGAIWFVSNCVTASKREKVIEKLSRHFRIDVAGRCAKRKEMKNFCPRFTDCDSKINQYYFIVIIENTICRDYITEKYWSRYHLPLIPIVMKRETYQHKIPSGSFIAVDDFQSAKSMGDYLTELINNKTKYMEYFNWRKDGWAKAPWNAENYTIGPCDLCAKLLNNPENKKPYENIMEWFKEKSNCDAGQFAESWLKQSSVI